MRSGGGLPLALVHGTYSVNVHDPARDVGKQLRRVQPPERLLRDEQRLPDHRGCVLHLLEALGRGRPQPHHGEGRLHRVRGPEMLPVLARELIERHHPLPVALEDAPDFSMRVSIGGNVLTLIPGGFCMWCCGFLSKEKIDAELVGPNRNYFENRTGEAQVVSLNGVAASQAVTEVLQLLTGFAGRGLRRADVALPDQSTLQRGFRKLDGVRGTLEEWGAARRPDCTFCTATLAAGVVAWAPAD